MWTQRWWAALRYPCRSAPLAAQESVEVRGLPVLDSAFESLQARFGMSRDILDASGPSATETALECAFDLDAAKVMA